MNYLKMYENGLIDEAMEEEEQAAMTARRAQKNKVVRQDTKRTKQSYISTAKKGEASRAAKAAKYANLAEKPQGKFEKSAISELQDEICGRKRGRR